MHTRSASSFSTYAAPIAILIGIFIVLTWLWHQSWWQPVDVSLLRSLDPIRNATMTRFFIDITYLGTSRFLIPLIIILGAVLIWRRYMLACIFLIANYAVERFINVLLKDIFTRPRPPLHHFVHAGGYSFPSGHAMNSLSIFGFVAFLLFYLIKNRTWRTISTVFWIILIFLVTFSRNYLQVHYVTDVLAGWCIAGIWLLLLIYLSRRYYIFRS